MLIPSDPRYDLGRWTEVRSRVISEGLIFPKRTAPAEGVEMMKDTICMVGWRDRSPKGEHMKSWTIGAPILYAFVSGDLR